MNGFLPRDRASLSFASCRFWRIMLACFLANSTILPESARSAPSKNNCRGDNNEEIATIGTTNRRVNRQQGRLTIKTPQKSVIFRDICQTSDESTIFTLDAYYRDLDYFLVAETSYEFYQYFLINGKTGAKIQLWAIPIFSPDRQRFFSMTIDELNGNTSVYIYRIDATGVKLEYRNTDKWRPTNPTWRGNNSIEFTHNPMSEKPTRAVLVRKNRGWATTQK